MTPASLRAGRFLASALLCLVPARLTLAAAASFSLTQSASKTLTPGALFAAEKTQTPAAVSPDGELTFRRKSVRLVAETGPENDMLSYRIAGHRNPTVVVTRNAVLTVLFVNTDDDMAHDLRFGPMLPAYPNMMAGLIKKSAGTPELAPKSKAVLHAEELTLYAPDTPGVYAYFCTVRGHAQGGMAGKVIVQDSASQPRMTAMPGMNMAGMNMAGMNMAGMGGMSMTSSVDLNSPMSQEASGTAWLPSSSPMYGKMFMLKNNMLMLHGAAMPRYTDVGSQRGDRRFDAPNWFMGMFSHPLTQSSQLGLRAMLSLDPVTEGGYGYPLLFQTGETWHHEPLHDRQHPHNFQSELSATYSHLLGGGKSAYLYLADPGEPALGPPTYMHRLLAYDLADAPLGHHWQDATHIQFGVATTGLNFGSKLKVEASDFTGREPDENRWSFQKARFDSYSSRLSFNPNADNAYQVSYGFIRNAEGDGVDQHRTTASWLYNRPLGEDANFTTALVWGQNNLNTEGKTNSYLAEADYQHSRDTLFTRIENIQKSGRELVLPEAALQGRKFDLGAYTAGYVRDLTHGAGVDTGLGFAVTADMHPSALNADYGSGTSLSFQVYLRFRPSRMKNADMMQMDMKSTDINNMDTGGSPPASPMPGTDMPGTDMPGTDMPGTDMPGTDMPGTDMPGMDMPQAAPAAVSSVTATIAPSPPKAQQANLLTLTVTGADGKPLTGATLTASVAMTSMDMGTSHPAFKEAGAGRYQATVSFAMPGPWRVMVKVMPPGSRASVAGASVSKAFDYQVGP